jgi:hypothetical protein
MKEAPHGKRAVVTHDGCRLVLSTYAGSERLAEVELDPLGAVALGHKLVGAGLLHLERAAKTPRRRRGGDPSADLRAQRDGALRDFAALVGADLNLEQRAAAVISRADRYRPAPGDECGAPERRALQRLASIGLPLPGKRQLRRILGSEV